MKATMLWSKRGRIKQEAITNWNGGDAILLSKEDNILYEIYI